MKKRKSRLPEIVDILTHNSIGSQEELSRQLASRGFNVTQATLSRDLKILHTTKVATEMGGYKYIITESPASPSALDLDDLSAPLTSLHPTALSLLVSGNIAVLKTRAGYAGGLAYDIDMLESGLVLGTIAGADTVFCVLREGATREDLVAELSALLPPEIVE